ncbi:MAG: hypothetical protein GY816_15510, partial [Cytophagales bacterium]|nr:hypothetical protein [Cytophagales bacterium]
MPHQAILRSEHCVTIPAGQGVIMPCKTELPITGCSLFQPLYTWQTKFIRISPGIVNLEKGTCSIAIDNHSDRVQKIYVNQKLGKIVPQPPSRIALIKKDANKQQKHMETALELDLNHLPAKEAQSFQKLCQDNREAFALSEDEIGESALAQLQLDVQGHQPIRIKLRELSHVERVAASEIIDNLLENKIIAPSV